MSFLLFVETQYGFGLTTIVDFVDWCNYKYIVCWREIERTQKSMNRLNYADVVHFVC